jgi:hypothetical protein
MAVQLADGRYVMSKEEAETYVRNNADVVLAISQGQFANASDHFNRYGQFEDRDGSPDTDDLDASVIDGSGFLYTNNMDINNPLADPLYRELTGSPDPTGGGDDSGGGTNNNQGGGTNNNQGGGGIMSSPVGLEAGALDPVTNLIGTTDSTGQSTLMGRQADLASDIAGVQSTVTPLAGQVTTLQDTVTPLAGDIGQVKTDVTDLATNVGTADANTGLFKPIGDIQTDVTNLSGRIGTADTDAGQTDLFAGQAGLAGQISGVGDTATAVQGLMGAPTEGGPQTLFESQQQLGQRIGTPVGEQTDLFAGQAGLARGQQTLTSDVDKVSRDLSAEAANIQNQIRGFEQAAQEYQAGATAKRGDIANTAIANQQALMGQIGGVGQTMNQQSEALAKQRQAEAAQFRTAQAPLQQQIANLTSNNQALQNNLQNIGPMGPMAADPRDALIQQLLTRNAS